MQKSENTTIVCPYCGADNPGGLEYCGNCGEIIKPRKMDVLAGGTTLKDGKYTVLSEAGFCRSAILYNGRISGDASEVVIREFYPASIAGREILSSEMTALGHVSVPAFETAKAQFRLEGKKLQALTGNPNLVRVRDIFDENGTVYIVEDRISGETLQDHLNGTRKLSLNQAIGFVAPVMEALIAAHKRKLIHGNINLSNIVISKGTPVLTDFGISNIEMQLVSHKKAEENEPQDENIQNKAGSSSAVYELAAVKASVSDDVYGIASVLYSLVTGKDPGTMANSEQETAARSVLEKESGIDKQRSGAIMIGLSRNPSGRFKSMEAFLKALKNSRKKKPPMIWMVAAAVVCVALVAGLLKINHIFGTDPSQATPQNNALEGPSSSVTEDTNNTDASKPEIDNSKEEMAEQEEKTDGELNDREEETVIDNKVEQEAPREPVINYMGEYIGVSGDFSIEGSPTVDPYVLGNTDYYRADIQAVTFLDSLDSRPANSWDISANKDGTVYAWVDIFNKLFIAADGIIALPPDCSGLFAFYTSVRTINFGNNVDTSAVANMRFMFKQDENLEYLDLSSFDTSNVVSMDRMFTQCHKITKLDLSSFDTSRTKDMTALFGHCYSLTDVNVSSFDTSLVEKMSYLFFHCDVIKEIDIRNFKTARVVSGRCMFYLCSNLETLRFDTGRFQTSSMKDMHAMFSNCPKLKYIDVSHFDTSHVTDMAYMFDNDSSLTNLAYNNFDMSQVVEASNMLRGTRWE